MQCLSPAEQVLRTDVAAQLKEMATLRAENARMGDALAAAGVDVPPSVHRTTSAGAGRSGDGRLTASALALHSPGAGRQSAPPPSSPRQPLRRDCHSTRSLSGSGAQPRSLERLATDASLFSRAAWAHACDLEEARARELSWQNPSINVKTGEDWSQPGMLQGTRAGGDFKPALYTRPGSWKPGSGSWSPPRPKDKTPKGKA